MNDQILGMVWWLSGLWPALNITSSPLWVVLVGIYASAIGGLVAAVARKRRLGVYMFVATMLYVAAALGVATIPEIIPVTAGLMAVWSLAFLIDGWRLVNGRSVIGEVCQAYTFLTMSVYMAMSAAWVLHTWTFAQHSLSLITLNNAVVDVRAWLLLVTCVLLAATVGVWLGWLATAMVERYRYRRQMPKGPQAVLS